MGTKLRPGKFDCYAKAEPDEPMFVLLARDKDAPSVVREWARLKRLDECPIDGLIEYNEKLTEAYDCANAMEAWRRLTQQRPKAIDLDGERWVIWSNEHSAWWAPGQNGYVKDKKDAGRYTIEEAVDICRNHSAGQDFMPNECMLLDLP